MCVCESLYWEHSSAKVNRHSYQLTYPPYPHTHVGNAMSNQNEPHNLLQLPYPSLCVGMCLCALTVLKAVYATHK